MFLSGAAAPSRARLKRTHYRQLGFHLREKKRYSCDAVRAVLMLIIPPSHPRNPLPSGHTHTITVV